MGGKSSPRTPEVPDPVDAIEAQARVNRVDTVSPFGSTRFVNNAPAVTPIGGAKGGEIGFAPAPNSSSEFTQVTELSPELQAVFDSAVGQAISPSQGTMFESRIAPDQRNFDTFTPSDFDSSRLEQSIFDRSVALLDPQFERRERSLRQNLANRGLPEGSEAATNALNFELDAQNRAREDLALAAVMAGQDAFERDRAFDFGTFRDERDFLAGQDQQDFARRLTLDEGDRAFFLANRGQGLNEEQIQFSQLAQLLGLTPQSPIIPIDAQGAINNSTQAAMDIFNAETMQANQARAANADILGSLATLVPLLPGFSDVRLKTNIQHVGYTDQGYKLYTWDWKYWPGGSKGVLSHEVPHLVVKHPSGFDMVDYGGISWPQ